MIVIEASPFDQAVGSIGSPHINVNVSNSIILSVGVSSSMLHLVHAQDLYSTRFKKKPHLALSSSLLAVVFHGRLIYA